MYDRQSVAREGEKISFTINTCGPTHRKFMVGRVSQLYIAACGTYKPCNGEPRVFHV